MPMCTSHLVAPLTSSRFWNADVETLARVASHSSLLSKIKELAESTRSELEGMKSEVVSVAVAKNLAFIDGVDRTLYGVTILSVFRRRVHLPLSAFHPEARAIVRRKATSAPAVARLSECRGAEQLRRGDFKAASSKEKKR